MTVSNWRQVMARSVYQRLETGAKPENVSWSDYHAALKAVPFQLRRNGVPLGLAVLCSNVHADGNREAALKAVLYDLAFLVDEEKVDAQSMVDWIEGLSRLEPLKAFLALSNRLHETAQLMKQTAGLKAALETAGANGDQGYGVEE